MSRRNRFELPPLHPFIGRDVPWLLESRCTRSATKTFLVYCPFDSPPETLSYGEFFAKVMRCAAGLKRRGIGTGDYVLIHLGNCPEFLVAWFACSWIGAIPVTTNTASAPGELRYFTEMSGARCVITELALLPAVAASGIDYDWIAIADPTRCGAAPPARTFGFDELLVDAPLPPRRPAAPDLFHNVMFTSGTTARPKGVVWTHANVLWAAERNASHEHLTADDVALTFLPLFHANALGYSMLATMWSGGTLALQPKLSISRFWQTVVDHHVTWSSAATFIYKSLKELGPAPAQLRLRFLGSGTGADAEIDPSWGVRHTLGWYGMTETVSHTILSDFDHPPSEGHSIGKPAPEYEQRLLDEHGRSIAPGQTGRLVVRGVRGVSIFAEYLNDPDATSAAFDHEGWFDTGDMLELRADGSLVFRDRAKDMLKVGGENVAASEVESVIQAVEGVLEVAVVGREHEFLHEVPWAFVVAGEPGEAMRARIEAQCARELARFKVPKGIEFLDVLPRLPIGKLDKKPLRARCAAYGPIGTAKR